MSSQEDLEEQLKVAQLALDFARLDLQEMELRATQAELALYRIEEAISPPRSDKDFGEVLDEVDALVFEARRSAKAT